MALRPHRQDSENAATDHVASRQLYERAIEPMSKRLPAAQRKQLAQRIDCAAYSALSDVTQRLHTSGRCAACNALRLSLQPALQTVGLCADEVQQRKRTGLHVTCSSATVAVSCRWRQWARHPVACGCLACLVLPGGSRWLVVPS